MHLVVGLGNPGEEYKKTRHNMGFEALEALAKRHKASFHSKPKFSAIIAEIKISSSRVILAMPQTFMNRSGIAVAAVSKFYKIPAEKIIVVYDEIDLDPGTLKIKTGGGSAGHKGIESIIEALGSRDFLRVRVGVGKPVKSAMTKDGGAGYVLSKVPRAQAKLLSRSVAAASEAVETIIAEGVSRAMNIFNASLPE